MESSPTIARYESLLPQFDGEQCAAYERFVALPASTKLERWKYTPTESLHINTYQLEQATPPCTITPSPFTDIVVFNGQLISPLAVPGLTVTTEHAQRTRVDADPMLQLNQALTTKQLNLQFTHEYKGPAPLHLRFVSSNQSEHHTQLAIELEENVNVDLLVSHESLDESPCLSNFVNTVNLKNNACLHITKWQNLNCQSHVYENATVTLQDSSTLHHACYDIGSQVSRTDTHVLLAEPGAQCHLSGIYLTQESQCHDHHSVIKHQSGQTESSEFFRGIVDGKAKAIFNGKIYIAKDAQKSKTAQLNKTLLLSERAEIYTKPELEIYADDVKASHGATSGQLDPDALFYLKTRGLNQAMAVRLMQQAFIMEIVEMNKSDLVREHVSQLIGSLL